MTAVWPPPPWIKATSLSLHVFSGESSKLSGIKTSSVCPKHSCPWLFAPWEEKNDTNLPTISDLISRYHNSTKCLQIRHLQTHENSCVSSLFRGVPAAILYTSLASLSTGRTPAVLYFSSTPRKEDKVGSLAQTRTLLHHVKCNDVSTVIPHLSISLSPRGWSL